MYRTSKKTILSTFVDILAVCANFWMEFYATVRQCNIHFITNFWKWLNLYKFNHRNPILQSRNFICKIGCKWTVLGSFRRISAPNFPDLNPLHYFIWNTINSSWSPRQLMSWKSLCLVRYLFVVSTSVIDCLGRFVPEMTYYVSSGMLNPEPSIRRVWPTVVPAQCRMTSLVCRNGRHLCPKFMKVDRLFLWQLLTRIYISHQNLLYTWTLTT